MLLSGKIRAAFPLSYTVTVDQERVNALAPPRLIYGTLDKTSDVVAINPFEFFSADVQVALLPKNALIDCALTFIRAVS